MEKLFKFADIVNKAITYILVALFTAMAVVIFVQVFSRTFLTASTGWTEEVSRLIMPYLVFLGAALALRYQRLISIEFLKELLTETKRKYLILVIQLISIVFFIFLLVYGIEMCIAVQFQTSAVLGLSMTYFYASIPVGSVLLMFNSTIVIIEELRKEATVK